MRNCPPVLSHQKPPVSALRFQVVSSRRLARSAERTGAAFAVSPAPLRRSLRLDSRPAIVLGDPEVDAVVVVLASLVASPRPSFGGLHLVPPIRSGVFTLEIPPPTLILPAAAKAKRGETGAHGSQHRATSAPAPWCVAPHHTEIVASVAVSVLGSGVRTDPEWSP